MKRILGMLLCWTCCLSAVVIPVEENLSISFLENGIEVWLKTNSAPGQTVSCRVIAKNPHEAVPQVFALNDCPLDAFEDELPYFIDDCKKKIINEAQCKMAVVAVGDFEGKELGEFLASAFEIFSHRVPPPDARMISVNPSEDSDRVYLSLSYPTSFNEIKTDQDLKKLWVLYLLQSIVEERFRKMVKEGDGQWIQPVHTKYLLPYANTIAQTWQMANQEPANMLKGFLGAMNKLKINGFTEQELSDAKAKLQKNLLSFYQKNPTSGVLADYLASHCSFGAGHPEYSIFMTFSFKAIAEIEQADVAELIRTYYKDATRRVEILAPAGVNVSEASIQEILDNDRTDHLVLTLPSAGDDEINSIYKQLPMTDAEAKIIYQIIDSVGNWGLTELYKRENEITDLGIKVQHVHPFKFLEVVFTNPHLKQSMTLIEGGFLNFKWRGFFDGHGKSPGFIAKCEREAARGNLAPFIVGFCQEVKANPQQVSFFIEKKEWEKLVRFLIKLET